MRQQWVLCVFLVACGLFAPCVYAFDGFFTGFNMETNANTPEGAAAGGGVFFGIALNEEFAAGARASYSNNFDTVSNLEPAVFFRWYPFLQNDALSGLFAQAELGGSIFFEAGKSYPAFLAGLSAGWRYNLGGQYYIEPTVRAGYPFLWAVGLSAGIIIDL